MGTCRPTFKMSSSSSRHPGQSGAVSTPTLQPELLETYVEVPCRDTFLPGVLVQAQPESRSPTIALILHGQMAHRNQIYHKPLVRALVDSRRMDSFRFDFAHAKYGAPGWEWHMARIQRDVEELKTVIAYLEKTYGYKVGLLVGHSKGALASYQYLCQVPDPPRLYVNLSGRYDMSRANEIMGPRYFPAFKEHGYYEWKVKVAGQMVAVKITPDQFEEFINHDTAVVNTKFPATTHVLTIHGDADAVVPVEDGKTYHEILSKRPGPGTSTLHLVHGGDHNFLKRFDEVVDTIIGR